MTTPAKSELPTLYDAGPGPRDRVAPPLTKEELDCLPEGMAVLTFVGGVPVEIPAEEIQRMKDRNEIDSRRGSLTLPACDVIPDLDVASIDVKQMLGIRDQDRTLAPVGPPGVFHHNQIHDSGKRRKFETGAVRDRGDRKGRYDLLSPVALDRLARWMELGAEKYDERNWEKGIPLSVYLDSTIRHVFKLLDGLDDEDHAAAIMWNSHGYIHTEQLIRDGKLPAELDDLPREKNLKKVLDKLAAVG